MQTCFSLFGVLSAQCGREMDFYRGNILPDAGNKELIGKDLWLRPPAPLGNR